MHVVNFLVIIICFACLFCSCIRRKLRPMGKFLKRMIYTIPGGSASGDANSHSEQLEGYIRNNQIVQ